MKFDYKKSTYDLIAYRGLNRGAVFKKFSSLFADMDDGSPTLTTFIVSLFGLYIMLKIIKWRHL